MGNEFLDELELVRSHPSEFVQQLDPLLRDFPEKDSVTCRVFKEVVDKIDTLPLLHLYGNTKAWFNDDSFNNAASLKIQGSIKTSLVDRWNELKPLGNVWVDPALENDFVPETEVTLYELFSFHGQSRGKIVEDKTDADTIFAWDGDVTPFDINSDYI